MLTCQNNIVTVNATELRHRVVNACNGRKNIGLLLKLRITTVDMMNTGSWSLLSSENKMLIK